MINKSNFEFYLVNNKNEKLDLLKGPFNLYLNEMKSKSSSDYDEFPIISRIETTLKQNLKGEEMSYRGACNSSRNKAMFEDYLLYQKTNFKLYMNNKKINKELYCYVDVTDIESELVDKYDEYEITLSLKRTTNWIREIPIEFYPPTPETSWVRGDLRPIIFGENEVSIFDNTFTIENKGHEGAPFTLRLQEGANNLEWILRDLNEEVVLNEKGIALTGKINYVSNDLFVIDVLNSIIYSNENELSHLRDRTTKCFFLIPKGTFFLELKNIIGYMSGVIYEQYGKY